MKHTINENNSKQFQASQSLSTLKKKGLDVRDKRRIIKTDRLVDAVLYNERLLLVLDRFGILLGFGDKTIADVCDENKLNTSLVLIVMNLFIDPSSLVEKDLHEDMIPALVDYLKQGHRHYLDEKLPYISGLIDQFIKNTENPDTLLLQLFFKEYAKEVSEHMKYEESTVFPYIRDLYNFSKNNLPDNQLMNFSINDFLKHHSNIEDKLEDLAQLLIKHFPPTKDRFFRNTILIELFGLQYDLHDHGWIEENILVPLVQQLEKLKTQK